MRLPNGLPKFIRKHAMDADTGVGEKAQRAKHELEQIVERGGKHANDASAALNAMAAAKLRRERPRRRRLW